MLTGFQFSKLSQTKQIFNIWFSTLRSKYGTEYQALTKSFIGLIFSYQLVEYFYHSGPSHGCIYFSNFGHCWPNCEENACKIRVKNNFHFHIKNKKGNSGFQFKQIAMLITLSKIKISVKWYVANCELTSTISLPLGQVEDLGNEERNYCTNRNLRVIIASSHKINLGSYIHLGTPRCLSAYALVFRKISFMVFAWVESGISWINDHIFVAPMNMLWYGIET